LIDLFTSTSDVGAYDKYKETRIQEWFKTYRNESPLERFIIQAGELE